MSKLHDDSDTDGGHVEPEGTTAAAVEVETSGVGAQKADHPPVVQQATSGGVTIMERSKQRRASQKLANNAKGGATTTTRTTTLNNTFSQPGCQHVQLLPVVQVRAHELSRQRRETQKQAKMAGIAADDSVTTETESHTTSSVRPGSFAVASTSSAHHTTLRESNTNSSSGNANGPTASEEHLVEAVVVEEPDERPSIVASVVNVEQERLAFRGKVFCWTSIVGIPLATLVIVLVMVFVVNSDNSNANDTLDHTAAATVPMTEEERFDVVQTILQEHVYNNGADGMLLSSLLETNEEETPQSQALHWMVLEDSLYRQLSSPSALRNVGPKLAQRYILAVFYFSMNQHENIWTRCRRQETGDTPSCLHYKLETYPSEGVLYDQHMQERAFRWLSPLRDECFWAGVLCTDGSHISKLHLGSLRLLGGCL